MANLLFNASLWRDNDGNQPPADWNGLSYVIVNARMQINLQGAPSAGDTLTFTADCVVGNSELFVQYTNSVGTDVTILEATMPQGKSNYAIALPLDGTNYFLLVNPGFGCDSDTITLEQPVVRAGFVFAAGDTLSPTPGPGVLTTLVAPDPVGNVNVSASYVRTIRGAAVVFYGTSNPYTLPLPEDIGQADFAGMQRQMYTWRSKKFEFPGMTTFAAAKVVHSCAGGGVRFRLYIDCCCVYETVVRGCVPFRLPPQLRGMTCEIELIGCSRVTEVRVASSIRELMGDE